MIDVSPGKGFLDHLKPKVAAEAILASPAGLPLVQMCLPSRHTVTDAGLASLCRLSGLVELDLTGYSHITDAGLQHLPQLWR